MSIRIIGTGSALPHAVVTNDDLAQYVETNDEWIASRTGIRRRHICTTETLSDLCLAASQRAVERAGLAATDIDLIICSTIGGDCVTPSQASMIGEQLGVDCPAFDLNAACAGFVYALDLAALYLNGGRYRHILIVTCEQMSRHVDWTDRATCVLFGDGAAACVVTTGDSLRYLKLTGKGNHGILHLANGNGNTPFADKKPAGTLHMNGQEVFKFAVGTVEKELTAAMNATSLKLDSVDHFLLHQANSRIIDAIISRLKAPAEKFATNIADTGNISSVSIPLLLDQMLADGRIQVGDTLVLSAFGAGMTTGTAVMTWA